MLQFKIFSFVLDPDTWFFFKRSSGILTPIEKNFIHVIKNNDGTVETQILLNAMETVYVPFIYDTFHLSTTQEKKVDQVKVKIFILFPFWSFF